METEHALAAASDRKIPRFRKIRPRLTRQRHAHTGCDEAWPWTGCDRGSGATAPGDLSDGFCPTSFKPFASFIFGDACRPFAGRRMKDSFPLAFVPSPLLP